VPVPDQELDEELEWKGFGPSSIQEEILHELPFVKCPSVNKYANAALPGIFSSGTV
jgi:hypothetical protein